MSPDVQGFRQAYGSTAVAEPTTRAAGYAAGYSAGYAAGAREAARVAQAETERVRRERAVEAERNAARLADALAVLANAARVAADRSAPVLAAAERTLQAAALELATAVLGVELADGATSARAALTRVLALDPEHEVHTVRLHPQDLAVLREALDAAGTGVQPAGLPDLTGVELVADPSLAPGDARGEFPEGYLDARVVAALGRARYALAETSEGADR
jgi:flagellar assembly protein FliH